MSDSKDMDGASHGDGAGSEVSPTAAAGGADAGSGRLSPAAIGTGDGAVDAHVAPAAPPSAEEIKDESEVEDDADVAALVPVEVLVLYTGGCIGMEEMEGEDDDDAPPGGLVPIAGFDLGEMLRALPAFQDHSQPDGYMPISAFGKRVKYTVVAYSPLLDSSDMAAADWERVAKDIGDNYYDYDAFVIIHGTDTMAYAASMLSFMLNALGKTVVLTGCQLPIRVPNSDAEANLLGALTIAGHYEIPEVLVYFDNNLFRGNRVSYVSATGLHAFESLNFPPIVRVGIDFAVQWQAIRPPPQRVLTVDTRHDDNVVLITLYPDFPVRVLRAMLEPPTAGAVLRTYGQGNVPMRTGIMEVLTEATERGVVVVSISSCGKGRVSAYYQSAVGLARAGVVGCGDMTVEAAMMKLKCLLGRGLTIGRVRALMPRSMAGEVTETDKKALDVVEDTTFVSTIYRAMHEDGGGDITESARDMAMISETLAPVLMCAAAASGDARTLTEILRTGVDPNLSDYDGRTAMHLAASEGHAHIVDMLLDVGASVEMIDRMGGTPLADAVRHNHPAVVALLRAAGATLKGPELLDRFMKAAVNGDTVKVAQLIDNGAPVSSADMDGRTALHLAASHGRLETCKVLLERGADVHALDRMRGTPIDDAVRAGHDDIVALLHAAGARATKIGAGIVDREAQKASYLAAIGQSAHGGGMGEGRDGHEGKVLLQAVTEEDEESDLTWLAPVAPPRALDVRSPIHAPGAAPPSGASVVAVATVVEGEVASESTAELAGARSSPPPASSLPALALPSAAVAARASPLTTSSDGASAASRAASTPVDVFAAGTGAPVGQVALATGVAADGARPGDALVPSASPTKPAVPPAGDVPERPVSRGRRLK